MPEPAGELTVRLDRILRDIEEGQVPLDELTGFYRQLKRLVTERRKEAADKAPIPRVLRARSAYKVRLAKVAPAEARGRLATDYPRCVLAVNLADDRFEGERLESILGWIDGHFERCQVLVGDSLHRLALRLQEDLPPEEARSEARHAAASWGERSGLLVERFQNCRFEPRRISELEDHPRRTPVENAVRRLYDRDRRFRRSVTGFARVYCRRLLARGQSEPVSGAEMAIGRQYLFEELGFFGALAGSGWNVICYPGRLRIFGEVAEGRFAGLPSAFKKFVYLSLSLQRRGISFHDESDLEEDLAGGMS